MLPKNIDVNGFKQRESWIWLLLVNQTLTCVFFEDPATATTNEAARLLLQHSPHDEPTHLISEILQQVTRSFHWVEADIKRSVQQMEAASLSRQPEKKVVESMNALLDKLYRWEKEWDQGIRWADVV